MKRRSVFQDLIFEVSHKDPMLAEEILTIQFPYRRHEDLRTHGELLFQAAMKYFTKRMYKYLPYPKPAADLEILYHGVPTVMKYLPQFHPFQAYYFVIIQTSLNDSRLMRILGEHGIPAYRLYSIPRREYGLIIPTKLRIGAKVSTTGKLKGRAGKLITQLYTTEDASLRGIIFTPSGPVPEPINFSDAYKYDIVGLEFRTKYLLEHLRKTQYIEDFDKLKSTWFPGKEHNPYPHEWKDVFKAKAMQMYAAPRAFLSGYGVLSPKVLELALPVL